MLKLAVLTRRQQNVHVKRKPVRSVSVCVCLAGPSQRRVPWGRTTAQAVVAGQLPALAQPSTLLSPCARPPKPRPLATTTTTNGNCDVGEGGSLFRGFTQDPFCRVSPLLPPEPVCLCKVFGKFIACCAEITNRKPSWYCPVIHLSQWTPSSVCPVCDKSVRFGQTRVRASPSVRSLMLNTVTSPSSIFRQREWLRVTNLP